MLALRLYGANDIRLEEVEIPEIGADEILLKTEAAAICGTDVRMWKNGQKGVDAEHPLILGHEFAGEIVKVGKDVPYYREGMHVGMQPNIGCRYLRPVAWMGSSTSATTTARSGSTWTERSQST